MKPRTIRRVFAVVLLMVSLALLAWGLWPGLELSRVLPISPLEMQLPTPTGWLSSLWVAG